MSEQGINDGGPAYPHDQNSGQWCPGMTLRQWYAGQALAGLAGVFVKSTKDKENIYDQADTDYYQAGGADESAEIAFALADAMIAHEQKERDYE